MSTDIRDQMARAICESTSAGRLFPWATLSDNERNPWRRMADAALAAQRQACTIETAEQLDQLPEQAVVRNLAFGVVLECTVENDGTAGWTSIGNPTQRPSVVLPALLLHHPDWETER